jgi:hypothetical protein
MFQTISSPANKTHTHTHTHSLKPTWIISLISNLWMSQTISGTQLTYIMHNENSSILHKHHKNWHGCSIKNTHYEGTKTKTNYPYPILSQT